MERRACRYPSLLRSPDCCSSLTIITAIDGAGWKADAPAGDGWQGDGGAGDDGWNGEISEQNTSKHADGFDAPHDGGCRK